MKLPLVLAYSAVASAHAIFQVSLPSLCLTLPLPPTNTPRTSASTAKTKAP